MRKIPAAAAEREEGQELRRRRRRRRRRQRQRRRLKLPAWCSECGRGGPGTRGAAAGKGHWEGVWGCGSGVSGVARALCGDRGGTRAPRGAGHRDSGALPGHELWGRQGAPSSGPATCLACSPDSPGEPPRSGDSHSLRSSRALSSPLVTPSSPSSTFPSLSNEGPYLVTDFPHLLLPELLSSLPCPSTVFPSVLCRVRFF